MNSESKPRRTSFALEFDSRLIEAAVERALLDRPVTAYWRERERIYAIDNLEERERAFARWHHDQFEHLAFADPFYQALAEQPLLEAHVKRFRVTVSPSRRQEGAELFVLPDREKQNSKAQRSVVVRVDPERFSKPQSLLQLLRHELFHIADMLDPAFGYDPALPDVPEGAARLKLVLDRYRVLWDTVIDGRLARLNPNLPETRLRRSREFCTAFWMLGERSEEAFGKWFNLRTPTHADLLQFALDPPDTAGTSMPTAGSTICPLCNCLGVFDRELLESLSPALVRQVHQDFPRWQTTDGACSQCIELYRGRPLSQAAAKLLPK